MKVISQLQPPPKRLDQFLDPVDTRAPVFTPRSGPAGTAVTVEIKDLPAVTPVYLGMGATRSSFEVLSRFVTDQNGGMSQVVEIPSWAMSDRTHFFVLVDVYFRPLAISEAFHVTEQDGTLVRKGRITTDESGSCLTMREEGESQELYALLGDTHGLKPGEDVVVEGTLTEFSDCTEGSAIQLTGIEPLNIER